MILPRYFTTQMFLSLKRSSTLPSSNWSGKPTLTLAGGSESTLGKRKRTVPSVNTPDDPASSVQARPIHVNRKNRRSAPFFGGAFATGFTGAGLTAALALTPGA